MGAPAAPRAAFARAGEFFQGVLYGWYCNRGEKLQKVPVTVSSIGEEISARLGTGSAGGSGGGLFSITFRARFSLGVFAWKHVS